MNQVSDAWLVLGSLKTNSNLFFIMKKAEMSSPDSDRPVKSKMRTEEYPNKIKIRFPCVDWEL